MNNLSAQQVLNSRQIIALLLISAIYIAATIYDINLTTLLTLAFFNLLYFFIIAYRTYIFLHDDRLQLNKLHLSKKTPTYSILIPLYKEHEVVADLIKWLSKLDYPPQQLQILLITEEDDQATIEAIKEINLPLHFKLITVKNSLPKTKAKACNYALKYVNSEFVTIYDAEDRPNLDQLRKVISEFEKGPDALACVQAKLCFYNGDENWLAAMFTIEYEILFHHILPSITSMNLPIPLGGTSNHFKTSTLKKIGGWDSYNVTEDAELGLRLACNGYKISMINSRTHEEAVIEVGSWVKQRSRWIKGHLHTYLCYLRAPQIAWRKFGFKGVLFITYALFLNPICLMTMPIISLLSINLYLNPIAEFATANIALYHLGIFNIFAGFLSLIYTARKAAKNSGSTIANRYFFTYPIYMLMHIYASMIALRSLMFTTHKWEKTEHGKSKVAFAENLCK